LVRAPQVLAETRLAEIEHVEQPLVLKAGDLLVVTDERQAGRSTRLAPNGEIVEAARIPCTLPEAFAFVKPGERVAFDDGAIWGVVRKATKTYLEIEIKHAAPTGSKLGSDKGINLPDTELSLSPLTQKEMLWLCEAAHIPVIWATQVLESLTKKGVPSRAEVSDAAMSARAECVMLNKGPRIVEAVRFLVGIHQRMKFHQEKKMAMLRKLSISDLRPGRKQRQAQPAVAD
jgi:pyruvate kinase